MTLPIEDDIFHADIEQLNRRHVDTDLVESVVAIAMMVFAGAIMKKVLDEMEEDRPESAFSRSKAVLARVKKGIE